MVLAGGLQDAGFGPFREHHAFGVPLQFFNDRRDKSHGEVSTRPGGGVQGLIRDRAGGRLGTQKNDTISLDRRLSRIGLTGRTLDAGPGSRPHPLAAKPNTICME